MSNMFGRGSAAGLP